MPRCGGRLASFQPAKASLKPKIPRPDERITLFPVFPDRLRLSDINLHVRSTSGKQDFVLEHFDLELDPKNPGELRLATLQLPNAPAWKSISGRTSYTNKNLILAESFWTTKTRFACSPSTPRTSIALARGSRAVPSSRTGRIGGSERTARSLDQAPVAENVSLDPARYLGPLGF